MTTFVLIHGAFHGAWCWYKVIPLLERVGHRVIAPDLASLGSDKTPISKVAPNTWADSIIQILDAETDPVVLVGHSRGGLIISQVAEARPEKVKTLVYLTAILLQNGQSAFDIGELDPESLIGPNLIINNEEGYGTIRKTAIREVFYADCREEDVVLARLMLQPEAMAPNVVPLHITPENFGRIPRVYIECLRDQALTPKMQKKMYTDTPCEKVISMDTSHSPFFSAPKELVKHLVLL